MSEPFTARPTTSGTDTREPRQLHPSSAVFSLEAERGRLRAEPSWTEHGRAARTLVKAPTQRLVLLLVRDGSEIGDDEAHAELLVSITWPEDRGPGDRTV